MATIEDYICQQLESSLRVKNKVTGMFEDVRDPEDGHVLTKEEGIALQSLNKTNKKLWQQKVITEYGRRSRGA